MLVVDHYYANFPSYFPRLFDFHEITQISDRTNEKIMKLEIFMVLSKEYIERRHGEPFKFLSMDFSGSQAVLKKSNYEL